MQLLTVFDLGSHVILKIRHAGDLRYYYSGMSESDLEFFQRKPFSTMYEGLPEHFRSSFTELRGLPKELVEIDGFVAGERCDGCTPIMYGRDSLGQPLLYAIDEYQRGRIVEEDTGVIICRRLEVPAVLSKVDDIAWLPVASFNSKSKVSLMIYGRDALGESRLVLEAKERSGTFIHLLDVCEEDNLMEHSISVQFPEELKRIVCFAKSERNNVVVLCGQNDFGQYVLYANYADIFHCGQAGPINNLSESKWVQIDVLAGLTKVISMQLTGGQFLLSGLDLSENPVIYRTRWHDNISTVGLSGSARQLHLDADVTEVVSVRASGPNTLVLCRNASGATLLYGEGDYLFKLFNSKGSCDSEAKIAGLEQQLRQLSCPAEVNHLFHMKMSFNRVFLYGLNANNYPILYAAGDNQKFQLGRVDAIDHAYFCRIKIPGVNHAKHEELLDARHALLEHLQSNKYKHASPRYVSMLPINGSPAVIDVESMVESKLFFFHNIITSPNYIYDGFAEMDLLEKILASYSYDLQDVREKFSSELDSEFHLETMADLCLLAIRIENSDLSSWCANKLVELVSKSIDKESEMSCVYKNNYTVLLVWYLLAVMRKNTTQSSDIALLTNLYDQSKAGFDYSVLRSIFHCLVPPLVFDGVFMFAKDYFLPFASQVDTVMHTENVDFLEAYDRVAARQSSVPQVERSCIHYGHVWDSCSPVEALQKLLREYCDGKLMQRVRALYYKDCRRHAATVRALLSVTKATLDSSGSGESRLSVPCLMEGLRRRLLMAGKQVQLNDALVDIVNFVQSKSSCHSIDFNMLNKAIYNQSCMHQQVASTVKGLSN